jgi:hypothetical protein
MSETALGWEELFAQLPGKFRPYALPLAWDRERLWALDLPVAEVPVAEFAWQLDLPWWRLGERFFALQPIDVLPDPGPYPEHYERMLAADLSFPIDVVVRGGRLFILDGVHRLAKAVLLDRSTLRVRTVPEAALTRIAAADSGG